MIQLVDNLDIDINAWDKCIDNASNSLIYAYSWYLDEIAMDHWDGLVLGDYVAVMPLVRNKKLGISYLYQPYFAQQLGVFSSNLTTQIIWDFLDAIPKHYKLQQFHLNFANEILHPDYEIRRRTTLLLDLTEDYSTIKNNYSDDLNKNLRKADKEGLFIDVAISPEQIVQLYQEAYGKLNPQIKATHYAAMVRLIHRCSHLGKAYLVGVRDSNNTLLAAASIFMHKHRAYYVMGAPTEEGKKKAAIPYLLDSFIQQYCESNMYLDFEGSEIPSVASFYKKFNPFPQYFFWVDNKTKPWWLKGLIKLKGLV